MSRSAFFSTDGSHNASWVRWIVWDHRHARPLMRDGAVAIFDTGEEAGEALVAEGLAPSVEPAPWSGFVRPAGEEDRT